MTASAFRWATVTDTTSGIRIRFDGESAALPYAVDSLIESGTSPGDRVWCQIYGTRVIILGKGGIGAGGHTH